MASRGWPERDGPAVDRDLAAAGRREPDEDLEQLVLALALEGHDAQHLARVELERDVAQLVAGGERANGEPDRDLALGARRGGTRDRLGRRGLARDLAEHEIDDPLVRTLGDVEDADRPPVPQDRRTVAQRLDLDEPMGDEDDAPSGRRAAARRRP